MAEKITIDVEVKDNLNNVVDETKSLKQQLREAQREVQDLSDKFGATSKEATEAAKRAADLKDRIGDAKDLTDAFNPDAKFNALSNSIGGVLNGFSAFEGAMGLVGVESKDVEKALLKVQSAMALSQGLQGLLTSIDSFKALGAVIKASTIYQTALTAATTAYTFVVGTSTGALKVFRIALASTGVGAIIIALGLAAEAMGLFGDKTDEAAEKTKKLKEWKDKLNQSIEKDLEYYKKKSAASKGSVSDIENEIALLKSRGATDKEVYEAEKKLIDRKLKDLYYIKGYRGKLNSEEIQEVKKLQNDKLILENEHNTKLKEIENKKNEEARKTEKENRETKIKNEKEYNEAVLKARKELDDEINKIGQDAIEKQNKAKQDRLEQAKKNEEDIYKNAKGFLESSIIDNENNIQAKKDLLEVEKEILLQNKELTEGEIAAIESKYRKDRAELDKQEIEDHKKVQELKFQSVQSSLTAISQLVTAFAGQSEKQQKRAFEINKAIGIAQATIDTFRAATSALKDVPYPYNFVAAGTVIASGLANVASIAKQQFNSPSISSGSMQRQSTPSVGNGFNTTPNINIVGFNQQSQIAQLNQQPIQAYVVSGQVTTQQALDRNRLRNATF